MAKRIVFTETGEVRPPRNGDWYASKEDGYPLLCYCAHRVSRTILTRTEETIPDPPKPRQVVFVPKGTLGPGDVHDSAFCDKGATYYSVEVPTKAEAYRQAVTDNGWSGSFLGGVNWLADKLGIEIE